MELWKISGEIPQKVIDWCNAHADGKKHFASFLQYVDGEIVERVFATRLYKGKGVMITEVFRQSTGDSKPLFKNLIYSKMAGYTPIFEPKDIFYRSAGYPLKAFGKEDFDEWDTPVMPIGVWRVYVNAEMLKTVPEFKYCGYTDGDVISYLNAYRKDHSLEMFGKMGIPLSPVLIAKCKKDKQFRRFLFEQRNEAALYGVQATIYAYQSKKSIEESRRICNVKNQNNRLCAYLVPQVKGTRIDRARLLDYLEEVGDEQGNLYDDYLKAVKGLGLDLSDTKNTFPKELHRMHDLRTAEYAALKEKQDAQKRKQMYKEFAQKADELQQYSFEGEAYSIIIPHSIADLINEGSALHHCVGKMGYDKKVIDGISLIAFCRKKGALETPFVTVEYRLDEKKLRQCYGERDSLPEKEVLAFVDEWAKDITKRQSCTTS